MKTPPIGADVCGVLCTILKDGVDAHQCAAAQALNRIDDVRATKALTQALLDEDEDVRTDAAAALVGCNDSDTCRQLLDNLIGDPCGEVKLSAIDALAAARYEGVVPWLRRLAVTADREVVWDQDGLLAGGWDDWSDVQLRAITRLGEMGVEEAVGDIVAAIANGDGQDVSEVGCGALAKLGPPGTKALAALLSEPDERHRRRAAACLAALDSPEAASGVVKALNDRAQGVRLAAGRVLAQRDPGDRRLELLLLDPVPEVRVEALGFCGASHPHRLELLLDDSSLDVRAAVVALLARTPTLIEAESEAGSVVSRVGEMFESGNAAFAGVAAQALAVLDRQGFCGKLIAAAGDADAAVEIRIGALKGLARIGGEAAIQTFVDVLGGNDRRVRVEAMSSLLKMASAGDSWPNPAGDALLDALDGALAAEPESEPDAQAELPAEPAPAGAVSLESLVEEDPQNRDADNQDVFPMSTLASIMAGESADESDGAKSSGAPAQAGPDGGLDGGLNEEDLEFLGLAQRSAGIRKKRMSLVAQMEPHTDVRVLAARLLGDLPRTGVSDGLAQLLESRNGELALAAADSLAHLAVKGDSFSPDTVRRLIGALGGSQRSKRLCAIRALAAAGCDPAVMPIINLLSDADSFVRVEAIRALVRLDGVAGGVRDLLDDPDPSVRLAAAGAVAHIGGADAADTLGRFALSFEGYHAREAARLVRKVDRRKGNAFFLGVLADEARKRYWQVAIEALAELNGVGRGGQGESVPLAQKSN